MENNLLDSQSQLGVLGGDSVCLICLQLYTDTNEYSDVEKLKFFQNVFNKVSHYLSSDIFGSCFLWNFVNEGSSPICSTCYSSVEKIFRINEKLEKLQHSIQDLVNSFTCEVLGHHNRLQDVYSKENEPPDRDDSSVLEKGVNSDVEYKPDVDIDIKDELRLDEDEESNDPINDENEFPLEEEEMKEGDVISARKLTDRALGNNSVLNNTGLKDLRIVLKRLEIEPSKKKSTKSTCIPEIKIVLTRLKIDEINVMKAVKDISEDERRPQRKAAAVANTILKKISGKENNILDNGNRKRATKDVESEEDWGSESESESGNEEFTYMEETSEFVKMQSSKPKGRAELKRKLFALSMHFKYKCNYKNCSAYFLKTRILKRHMKIHDVRSSTKCSVCSKKFKTTKDLASHNHYRHKEKSFKCTKCEKAFLNKLNLKLHLQTHNGQGFECEICYEVFKWRISLNYHNRIKHNDEKYNCSLCYKKCRNRLHLLRHRSTHFASKITDIFPCRACKKVHFNEKIWDKCIIKHFRKRKQKGAVCAICGSVFKTAKDLDKHSVKMKHLNKKLFKCLECIKIFYRQVDLKYHRKLHRNSKKKRANGSKNVPTGLKKKITNRSKNVHADLKKKMTNCSKNVHTDLKKKLANCSNKTYGNVTCRREYFLENTYFKYKCTFQSCSKAFQTLKALKKHIKIKSHADVSCVLSKCELCPKKFKSPKDFCRHNYYNHSDKQFKCSKCDKSFRKNLNLKFHSKVHSGKHFKCQVCPKQFIWRVSLVLHNRMQHSEEGYSCTVCKIKFRRRLDLVQHRSTHFKSKIKETFPCSGCKNIHFVEKIWDRCIVNYFRKQKRGHTCAICTTVFKSFRELDIHSIEKNHLNKKNFTCLRCKKGYYRREDLNMHKLAYKSEKKKAFKKSSIKSQDLYNCDKCHRKFCSSGHLHKHLRLHKKENIYCCAICKKQYKDIRDLRDHLNIHTGEMPYQCKLCDEYFHSRYTLKGHAKSKCPKKKIATRINAYNCDICSKTFRSRTFLSKHMDLHKVEKRVRFSSTDRGKLNEDSQILSHSIKRTKRTEKYHVCGCNEKFLGSHNFLQHQKNCARSSAQPTIKGFECVFCDKVFNSERKYILHRKIYNKKKRLPCKLCGKSIAKKYMRGHLRTHSAEVFKCSQCDLTLNSNSKLQRHIIRVHSEETPFSCPVCNMKFKVRMYLNRHLRRHEEKSHLCDVCGKSFVDKDKLNIHKKKHTGDLYACPYCTRKFYSRYALKEHTSVKHHGKPPKKYSCDLCGNTYTTALGLRSHKRTHTGERPFPCTQCEMKFISKQNLELHVERQHSEKSLKCDFCEKCFGSANVLKTHVINVHSERKFQCEFCSYFARQSAHLKTHIKTIHTKEKSYVCDSCGKAFARKDYMDIHIKNVHEKSKIQEKECTDSDSESE